MASNTDASLLGVDIETGLARKISTVEQATAGQTVIANNDVLLLETGAIVGAVNQAGAVWESSDSYYFIRGNDVNVIFTTGAGVGNFLRDTFYSEKPLSNFQILFTTIRDSKFIFTTRTPIMNFRPQVGGVFTGNRVDVQDTTSAVAFEFDAACVVENNTYLNLTSGFLNFAGTANTQTNINIEQQNLIGITNRLGFTNFNGADGGFTFIDCLKDGVYFTESQIKGQGFLCRNMPTSTSYDTTIDAYKFASKFAKRQNFKVIELSGADLSANITYRGNNIDDVLIQDSDVNHVQVLFRTNQNTGGQTSGQIVLTDFLNYIDASNPVTRKIFKYGFITLESIYSDYDSYETVEDGTLLSLTIDESITENDISIVNAYTSLEIAQKFYDRSEDYRNDPSNIDVFDKLSISGETVNVGAYNVVLNSTGVAFAFDGTTITINVGTAMAYGIITTGTITVDDTVDITGATFSSLNLTNGRDLIDVAVTGTITFNDNVSATYDMLNSTIGTIVNDGTGLLEWSQIGSTVTDFTDTEVNVFDAFTPSDITLVAPNGNWAIYNNTNTRIANGSGDTTYTNIGGVDTGTWSVVVHREGYQAEIFTWVTDDGSSTTLTYSNTRLNRPEGGAIYSNGDTSGLTTLVNADNRIEVQASNAGFAPQQFIDAQQNFLSTVAGLDWIFDTQITVAPTWGLLFGTTYMLNITGFQYDSIAGTTPASALEATLVSSATHDDIRLDNGGIQVVSATSGITMQDIRDAMLLTPSVGLTIDSGSIDEQLTIIETDTNELQTNQGNWVTATGFAVAGDEMSLVNNAITSNKIANNAFTNSAFTTGYYNSINSEVDQALNDYDAPTKAELDTAQNAIVDEINANEAKIDNLPTLTEMQAVADDFKADDIANQVWSDTTDYTGLQKGKLLKDAKDKANLAAGLSA